MGCVYIAINRSSGKAYIGKTITSLERRRAQHENDVANGSTLLFHHALRKYGRDAFSWFALCNSDDSAALLRIECECIAFFSTISPDGYNLTTGGQGGSLNDEVRRKISKTLQGHSVSEETRRKLSEARRGRKCPAHSAFMKGRKQSAESNAKCSKALMGKPKSDEAKANMSIAAKNKSPQAKKNSADNLRGAIERRALFGISDETRQKLVESHQGKTESAETRAKKSRALKGRVRTEETRARMRLAQQKRRSLERVEALP